MTATAQVASTAVATRPRPVSDTLAGIAAALRLVVRRSRVRLAVWVLVLVGMFAWAGRYLLFAFGNAQELVLMYYLGIALHGICYDFFFVTGQIYVDRAAPKAIQASAQGFITLVTYGVGMLIGTWVSGPVVDMYARGPADAVTHDWTAIWLWPAAMAVVIILLFAFFFSDRGTDAGAQKAA